jgi:hypothetical protein
LKPTERAPRWVSDQKAALKLLYLAVRNAGLHWRRAIEKPKTWLSCVASLLAWFTPTKTPEASKFEENQQAGTPTFSKCFSSVER